MHERGREATATHSLARREGVEAGDVPVEIDTAGCCRRADYPHQEEQQRAITSRTERVVNPLPLWKRPLVNAEHLAVDLMPGAKLAAGGTADGPYYKPTVLTDVTPKMRAFREEVFGPVASIVTFSTDDEAVALANDNEYGLSAGVFSASLGRAMAVGNQLRTGLLHINDQTVADEPHVPFGGTGASGNGTRIGGPANWEEFTHWQWVTIKDKAGQYPF